VAIARDPADLGAGLGRDDDPDLVDARGREGLDAVDEHRLVGHRHELLGARVRDGAQARAGAARQDQALQLLHQYAPPSLVWSHETMRVGRNVRPTRFWAWARIISSTSGLISA